MTDRMPPRSDDWEAAEVALREFLDDDDAVSVLQVLQSRGWFSPSESGVPPGLTAEKLARKAKILKDAERARIQLEGDGCVTALDELGSYLDGYDNALDCFVEMLAADALSTQETPE